MSALGLFLVIFGVAIILTRGPLIFAPLATQKYALRLLETDARIRMLGVVAAALSVWLFYVASVEIAAVADTVLFIGVVVAAAAFFYIAFPKPMGDLVRAIVSSFNAPLLRILGVIAVALGVLIAGYGASL
jgi:uncharacterized protein YjeT (DUF2065 family)